MTSEVRRHKVLIIGTGPAGLTAAIYTARANLNPLIIHGPLPGGQLTTTTEVENYPGFVEGIMGPELMERMEQQARRFGAEIVVDLVTEVDLSGRPFKVKGSSGLYECSALIVATGAKPRLLGLPEEKELMGYGVSTCATCDGAFYRGKIITVVGGGDSACEEALFLTRFGRLVYLVHRRDELRASRIMRERVLGHPGIKPLWNRHVKKIHGSRESGVTGMTVEDVKTGAIEEVKTDGFFVAIGHTPSSALFRDSLELDQNGYIITQPDSTATNIPGVFACGDVRDHTYRQAITAAGSGCMAAIDAERWCELCGE